MTDDDAELVALIDNELDDSSKTALLARLAADERLRHRYEELQQTTSPLPTSFDALLGQAPWARPPAAPLGRRPGPRPPRKKTFGSGRGASRGSPSGGWRRELSLGFSFRAPSRGLRQSLGCLGDGRIGAPRLSNTRTCIRTRPSTH